MKDIDTSLHRLPPQNLEAEQSILGGILLDNQSLNSVLEILTHKDFYSEAHRKIFAAIVALSDRNEPCDLITLSSILKDQKHLDNVGGAAYLASLVDNVPSAANIAYYSKIVKEKAILRHLIGTATEILTNSYDTGAEVDDVLDKAEHAIFEISENKIRPAFYPIKSIIKDSFKTIEKLYERKELITGVPTGFEKIDDLTSGLQKSDLIIVAGRPSIEYCPERGDGNRHSRSDLFPGNVERTVGPAHAFLGGPGRLPASPEGLSGGNGLAETDHGGRPAVRSAAVH